MGALLCSSPNSLPVQARSGADDSGHRRAISRSRKSGRKVLKHAPSTISSNSFRVPPKHCSLYEGRKEGPLVVFIGIKDGSDTTTDQIDKYIIFTLFLQVNID